MASFANLPVEMLEMVFQHFDGASFARALTVCKKWRSVAERMKTFWRSACLKEMDHCVIEELLGYRTMTEIESTHPIWRNIYAKWYRGCMVSNDNSWIKTFVVPDDNPITQIKTSGAYVLTGHRSGCVFAWDQLTGQRKRCLVQHLMMVVDFVLVDILHSGPYGTPDSQWDHHHIVSVSKDPTVQVNSLLCGEDMDDELEITHYHSCGFINIKSFGKKVAVAATDNRITIFDMKYVTQPTHKLVLTITNQIAGPSELLQNFQFWQNEFQCYCLSGIRKFYDNQAKDWVTVAPQYLAHEGRRPKKIKRNIIRNSFFFRSETVILTTPNTLLVSIDGTNYSECTMFENITMQVVCLKLYNSILAIGTESGHLLLYYAPEQKQLITAKNLVPSWSRYLNEASIVAISISDNEESPVIAACTTERMFIVKWHSVVHGSTITQNFSSPFLSHRATKS